MYLLKSCGILLLSFVISGCVSLSRYNERVGRIQSLEFEISSLERTLRTSERDRKAVETELRTTQESLAKLQNEHEALISRSGIIPQDADDLAAIEAEKRQFAEELAALIAKLAEADHRIRELSTLLAVKEAAVRRIPTLEAAVREREWQIKELTGSLQSLESYISQIKEDATDLSRRRSGNEEKERTGAAIRTLLRREAAAHKITVREYRDKVIIAMKDQVLFESGSARISKTGRNALGRLAKVLARISNNQILVEGHTDTVPFKRGARYGTNWDLAAARAANVLKFLEKKNVKPELLALAGYSCYLPAVPNDCTRNRQLNRRVEIAVIPLEMERLAAVQGMTAKMR